MKFKGRNGGLAIILRNHMVMFRIFIVSLAILLIPTAVFILQKDPYFWLLLLPSAFFLILSLLMLIGERYHENVFLQGTRKDHVFEIRDGIIYKDRKEIRLVSSIRIYRFRGFLYMETSHSMFVIRDGDYTSGSRQEFLSWAKDNEIPVRIGY